MVMTPLIMQASKHARYAAIGVYDEQQAQSQLSDTQAGHAAGHLAGHIAVSVI